MRKAIKCGEDFVRDEQWNPIVRNRKGVEALGGRSCRQTLREWASGLPCLRLMIISGYVLEGRGEYGYQQQTFGISP